jgi:hypothetical protein
MLTRAARAAADGKDYSFEAILKDMTDNADRYRQEREASQKFKLEMEAHDREWKQRMVDTKRYEQQCKEDEKEWLAHEKLTEEWEEVTDALSYEDVDALQASLEDLLVAEGYLTEEQRRKSGKIVFDYIWYSWLHPGDRDWMVWLIQGREKKRLREVARARRRARKAAEAAAAAGSDTATSSPEATRRIPLSLREIIIKFAEAHPDVFVNKIPLEACLRACRPPGTRASSS